MKERKVEPLTSVSLATWKQKVFPKPKLKRMKIASNKPTFVPGQVLPLPDEPSRQSLGDSPKEAVPYQNHHQLDGGTDGTDFHGDWASTKLATEQLLIEAEGKL